MWDGAPPSADEGHYLFLPPRDPLLAVGYAATMGQTTWMVRPLSALGTPPPTSCATGSVDAQVDLLDGMGQPRRPARPLVTLPGRHLHHLHPQL